MTKRPKVMLLCQPPDGGAPELAVQTALGIAEVGFEAEFIGPPHARRHSVLETAGIRVHRVPLEPGFPSPISLYRSVVSVAAIVRQSDSDLIHSFSAPSGSVGRLVAARTRTPNIYSPQCFPFIGEFSAARRAAAWAVEKGLAPLTQTILCCSEDERRIARRHRIARDAKLSMVHNGSPCCDSPDVDLELRGFKGDGLLVGCVAAFRRQKRIDVLLHAVKSILHAVPEARVAIVGEGPEESKLRAIATTLGLDTEPRFGWFPFTPPASRYLQSVDVSVLSSSWEGLPVAVLEAMACGVPQVATDVGGTREALDPDSGILVAPENSAQLAYATIALLNEPERRASIREHARARHDVSFSIRAMVHSTASVYGKVLETAARG